MRPTAYASETHCGNIHPIAESKRHVLPDAGRMSYWDLMGGLLDKALSIRFIT